jgi:hypothetical protein
MGAAMFKEKCLAIHRSGFWDADAKVPRPAQVLDGRERPRVVDQQPAHGKLVSRAAAASRYKAASE